MHPIHKLIDTIDRYGLAHLAETYAIKASRHPEYENLVLLKYNQIDSPMGEELVQVCRGIILDESNDWRVVSYPYGKFFNHGEGHASAVDWNTARVYEKLDGSLTTLFHYAGEWHVATSGSPGASGPVNLTQKTFKQLFWETFEKNGYSLDKVNTDLCYMFELMTPENRVVVPHKEYKLVLHGARNRVTYEEYRPDWHAAWNGWECVETYDVADLDGVLTMADSLKGLESEGFVVCDSDFNRVKIKAKSYVALHHLKDSLSLRRLVETVQANEGSEFLQYFPEFRELYENVKTRYDALCVEVAEVYDQHKGLETQKDFALAVKHFPYSGGLFATRAGKCATVSSWLAQYEPRKMIQLLGLKEQDDVQTD